MSRQRFAKIRSSKLKRLFARYKQINICIFSIFSILVKNPVYANSRSKNVFSRIFAKYKQFNYYSYFRYILSFVEGSNIRNTHRQYRWTWKINRNRRNLSKFNVYVRANCKLADFRHAE